MRLIRTTVPTMAALASIAALVTGVVVSTVEARHHKSSHKPSTTQGGTLGGVEQQALAHHLSTMQLPTGLTHTVVCPRLAGPTDACFAGTSSAPVSSTLDAIDEASRTLASLGVTLSAPISCTPVSGGPQGSGYSCGSRGTWHTAPVSATLFIANPDHRPAGVPGVDAMLSVLPAV